MYPAGMYYNKCASTGAVQQFKSPSTQELKVQVTNRNEQDSVNSNCDIEVGHKSSSLSDMKSNHADSAKLSTSSVTGNLGSGVSGVGKSVFNVAPPLRSPAYTTVPPPSPGYTMPPPFHHPTNYKPGRLSPIPTQDLKSTSGVHYSFSPTSGGQVSPHMLHPPPRSPNILYQPSSPSLSYFSHSVSSSRQRTLIEVPRIDQGPVPNNPAVRIESEPLPNTATSDTAGSLPDVVLNSTSDISTRLRSNTGDYSTTGPQIQNTFLPAKLPDYEISPTQLSGAMANKQLNCVTGGVASNQMSCINIVPNNLQTSGTIVNKSTLDPNVRPFTPSNKFFNYVQYEGIEPCDSISYLQKGYDYEKQVELQHSDVFTFHPHLDPLPKDGIGFIPDDFDTTVEDLNNNNPSFHNNNINNNNIDEDENNNNSTIHTKLNKQYEYNNNEEVRCKEKMMVACSSAMSPLLNDIKWRSNLSRPTTLTTPSSLLPSENFCNYESKREPTEVKSRLLVSGLEQSLDKWVSNQQMQLLHQQASFLEKIKRRMANGHHAVLKDPNQEVKTKKPSYGGIFSQDLSVPPEYQMSHVIGDRIRPINIRQEHTDLLFFLFYTMHGDAVQLVAASLLFERGWRFHKQQRIWLARWPGVRPEEKTTSFEKGLYQYFDMNTWKRIPGWFRLDYCQLAEKTVVPEDLKTMYTKYAGLLTSVNSVCSKNIALHGFNQKGTDGFDQIENIKYMSCLI